MAFRIRRNQAGNCITFEGASQPVYWNACLSAEISASDATLINIINDVKTAQSAKKQYEFFRVPFNDFADADGVIFTTAQEAVDYINKNANVLGLSSDGIDLTDTDVNFRLDETSTSIIMDNGYSFGVNTIKALDGGDGTIHIHAIESGLPSNGTEEVDREHFKSLDHTRVSINSQSVSGGLDDVINSLNELFTVGAFQSIVISDPYSTLIADVDGVSAGYTLEGSTAVDPTGDDIFTNSSSGNYAGLKSTATINQAGEYFTFDIRGEGQIGFGLVHTQTSYDNGYYSGTASYADPTSFAVTNSAHYGFQFSHWFHPTPNGSWTNYGANTSFIRGGGWSSWESQDEWLAGDPVKVKVGIDENGFIAISTLQDDDTTWILHARSAYPVTEGSEFHLGIKAANSSPRVFSAPKVHLLEETAPTMNFRYVESPDGVFNYPVFATAEEAEYYDQNHDGITGTGTYTTIVFPDDPTFTTWYVPTTGYTDDASSVALGQTFQGNAIQWTEVTTLSNAELAPPAFSAATLTVNESSSVNYQTQPQDTGYTTVISGLPVGLIDLGGGIIGGTAPEVAQDNVANPSDTYTITVTRSNTYGSSAGTLTLVVNNLTAPVVTAITGFTHDATTTALIDDDIMDDGSAVTMDETLSDFERLVILREYVETNILPSLQQAGDKYYIGVVNSAADLSSLEDSDFDVAFVWEYQTATTHQYRVIKDGVQQHQTGIGSRTAALFDYAIEAYGSHLYMIACNENAINTEPSPAFNGSFSNATEVDLGESYPLTITFAYVGSHQANISTTSLSEIVTPAPDNWVQVTASPATVLNFDGSTAMPTLQAGYTYRFLMGDTVYSDLSTATNLAATDILRFTADGSTEYTTGITRVGSPSDTDTFGAATAYVEFAVPADVPPLQWYNDNNGIGTATAINISGSTYVVTVTGITQEGPTVNQTGTNLFNDPDVDADGVVWGWLSIDEQLGAGERLVLDNAFMVDLTDAMPDNSGIFIGLKSGTWTNNLRNNSIANATYAGARFAIYRYSASDIRVLGYITGATTISRNFGTNGILNNSLELAFEITSSGNNIRLMMGSSNNSSDDVNSTAYADWSSSYKTQTGDQGFGITSLDIMVLGDGNVTGSGGSAASGEMDSADIDWTGLSEINVPTPPVTNLTSWAKALDFSGSSERTQMASSSSSSNPIMMAGTNNQVSAPTTSGNTVASGHPWATAIVFKSDKNSSNQHIWNLGEGAGTTDDNIYLRTDAAGKLYFGWGRQGDLCEMLIHPAATGTGWTLTAENWYGIYIAHNGTRYGSNNTTSLMADAFDIRLMGSSNNWGAVNGSDTNLSVASDWTISGDGRMNRQYQGDMTIGGRGANRNFHGKVASMVVTTLKCNVAMPDATEIEMMIKDPIKWIQDYKEGNTFRQSLHTTTNTSWDSSAGTTKAFATQVWLMGDGTSDSYSNMIRNQVFPSDQNYTKMNMISMVSNDIENVTIAGLS